mmetsp:Transcript_31949/g.28309  ORF Transcript_31949/g.28309 Transcript_31949/m.28309 type:complete len:128 (+) Transcript_31949:155-538(+)
MLQHEKYLYRFVSLFKTADTDKDGIINEDQFKYLLKEMNIIPPGIANDEEKLEEEIEKLLVMIDPHKTQQITFSEIVTFLTLTEFNDVGVNKDLQISEIKTKEIKGEKDQSENISITLLDKINEGVK